MLVIVLTDGVSDDPAQTVNEATALRNFGAEILVVGVGATNVNELNAIAGNSSNVFSVSNFADLQTVSNTIATSACQAGNFGFQ